jgi:DNA-binding XRE family transcriptional regulator
MTTAGQPASQWIKQRRRELGLTQEALADRAGCSWETVRTIEGATLRPSRQLAGLPAEALEFAPVEREAFITSRMLLRLCSQPIRADSCARGTPQFTRMTARRTLA